MALQSGLDLVSIVSFGVYSETYGAGEGGNIANLFASFGYLEDASAAVAVTGKRTGRSWLLYHLISPMMRRRRRHAE